MPLIKSISGMRGTLGGTPGNNLTPIDIIEFTSAYGTILLKNELNKKVVIGRDGRISGPHVQALVTSTLQMMGIDIIDLGLSTTPTVEMEVVAQNAGGGIIITASHNAMEYNALKFLNEKGEFISAEVGQGLLDLAEKREFKFIDANNLGKVSVVSDAIQRHIEEILKLQTVNSTSIKSRGNKVVVDCINSTGSISIPVLCSALNVECILINEHIGGVFAHNPEPLEHNLIELSEAVISHKADLGIAVDPDVDRLAFVDENGTYCGEEYTLVMIADYILSKTPGATVSNLSSTKALRDITERHGQSYYAAAVGEVNVVNKIRSTNAIIGGEGNGGIIYPTLHAGRDALVGIALLLSALSERDISLSTYRATFPDYEMIKDKLQLTPELNVEALLSKLAIIYKDHETDTQDGLKIYINNGWAHLRKSNTEPIIRIYAEGPNKEEAMAIANGVRKEVDGLLSSD